MGDIIQAEYENTLTGKPESRFRFTESAAYAESGAFRSFDGHRP